MAEGGHEAERLQVALHISEQPSGFYPQAEVLALLRSWQVTRMVVDVT